MTLKSLFKRNPLFFLPYIFFLLFGVFVLGFYSKADGFFVMNPYHSYFLDQLFIRITYLGDGIFIIGLALILFFFRRRFLALMILSSYLLSGIIAQILKYFIIEARPAVYLEKSGYPYFIEDVTLHNFHSFPSGHTASIFALASILSFSFKNKSYSIIFLIIAAATGYSRIYLGQHFMEDVFVGSIIGVLSSIACWLWFKNLFEKLANWKKAGVTTVSP